MRILFISNLYPPHDLGGMEIRCEETVKHLRARGHTCHVLTSCYGTRETSAEDHVTRALYLEADIHYYRPLDFFLRRPWQEHSNRRTLRETLDVFKPDVVFIWGMWNLSTQVAYWVEQWLPGRIAYSIAGYWPMQPSPHEAYWEQPARRLWARALMAPARWLALRTLAHERATYTLALEHVACVSEYVRRKLSAARVLPHGAKVIYNGIDPLPFLEAAKTRSMQATRELRLVYTGGLIAAKGVHTAIEALGLLHRRGVAQDISLTLVGSGHPDYERRLREQVQTLGLDRQVIFNGRVPREQIADILAHHDIFLFTSTYEEPIARSVMEAMAAGLAVIGTDVGGQREMLEDGINGLVYPPGDAGQLAECILRLQRDPDLCLRLADEGRQTVLERFTLERMIDEMETWLGKIVA